MKLYKLETGNTDALLDILSEINHKDEYRSVLVLLCDESSFDREKISEYLTGYSKSIVGGIYPELINGSSLLKDGALIVALKKEIKTHYVDSIDDISKIEIEKETKSIMFFFDGLNRENDLMIEEVYLNLGNSYNYIGGGAGSLSFVEKPCVISNKGILQGTTLIVETSAMSSIGVAHGWEEIGPSLRVKSDGRYVINQLDYKPAFDTYRDILAKYTGKKITKENFFEIAKFHPFGIFKFDGEFIVRDPIKLEKDGIISIGVVPDESFIKILSGDSEKLISAARKAKKHCDDNFDSTKEGFTFVVDCISRALSLGDEFHKEAAEFDEKKTFSIGILSLGEIANMGSEFLDIYNKTVVVSKIED